MGNEITPINGLGQFVGIIMPADDVLGSLMFVDNGSILGVLCFSCITTPAGDFFRILLFVKNCGERVEGVW